MDNFKVMYKILKALEGSMDLEEFDTEQISPKVLEVSEERWTHYLEMLSEEGLVKGVAIKAWVTGTKDVDIENIKITMKGLQYLEENSMMKKIAAIAKGIKDTVPGL